MPVTCRTPFSYTRRMASRSSGRESDAVHTRVHCDMYLEAHAVLPGSRSPSGRRGPGRWRSGSARALPAGGNTQGRCIPGSGSPPWMPASRSWTASSSVAVAKWRMPSSHSWAATARAPVSVSVRLHHAHDPAARWQKALVAPDVVGQGLPVQFNPSPIHLSPCRRSAAAPLPKILDPAKRSYQWQFFSEYPKSAKKASFLQVFCAPKTFYGLSAVLSQADSSPFSG